MRKNNTSTVLYNPGKKRLNSSLHCVIKRLQKWTEENNSDRERKQKQSPQNDVQQVNQTNNPALIQQQYQIQQLQILQQPQQMQQQQRGGGQKQPQKSAPQQVKKTNKTYRPNNIYKPFQFNPEEMELYLSESQREQKLQQQLTQLAQLSPVAAYNPCSLEIQKEYEKLRRESDIASRSRSVGEKTPEEKNLDSLIQFRKEKIKRLSELRDKMFVKQSTENTAAIKDGPSQLLQTDLIAPSFKEGDSALDEVYTWFVPDSSTPQTNNGKKLQLLDLTK